MVLYSLSGGPIFADSSFPTSFMVLKLRTCWDLEVSTYLHVPWPGLSQEYFQNHHGDWLAVDFKAKKERDELSQHFRVEGIPSILADRDGDHMGIIWGSYGMEGRFFNMLKPRIGKPRNMTMAPCGPFKIHHGMAVTRSRGARGARGLPPRSDHLGS